MTAVDNETALWWILIGIGVAVTLCVVVLLSLLSAFVRDIEHNVRAAGAQLGHLANNTGTHPHVHQTAQLISALGVELQAHNAALSRTTGPL
ncbi:MULTISPECIES: hypothetical protein [unclassified Nocardioides]|uniref:hypothetical protein n=1 Tax=unclassified Nocardioides TaxID=2615069 RepID=UPI0006FCB1DF|nr:MULTISPECIES: hypothetical protein [unclassified Nocardioides]KRA27232.1 hypothetical protein ASD81_24385 [Nocardioides sp. Root614]KRA91108.1 hypothetical protein ASD84_00085 [Nocardioides sp. Root682]